MKIKFRAWLKARKIMCEVDSIHFDMDIVLITYPLCGTLTQSMHVDFDDVILMQYIETKDDNDVEICEGDTLKYSTYDGVCIGVIEKIKASESCLGGWGIKVIKDVSDDHTDDDNNYFEIIGNIYENPELLEVK